MRGVAEGLGRQAAGGAHGHQLFAEQLQALGARARTLAEVERHIAAPLQQVIGLLLIAQVQMDMRMLQAPALEPRHQPAGAEGRRGGDPQHLGFATVGAQVVGRHLDLGEDLAHFHQVQVARRRQLQAPAHSAKQQVLQQLFELGHLFAHCTLGQVELFGGAGEAQVPGDRLETLQGSDRRQVAFIQHGEGLCSCFGAAVPAQHE